MNTFFKALKSRTMWVLYFTAILGAMQALQPFMDAQTYMLVNTVLLALAGYFKLAPSQNY